MAEYINETGCLVSVSRITNDVVCQQPSEDCDCLIVALPNPSIGDLYPSTNREEASDGH